MKPYIATNARLYHADCCGLLEKFPRGTLFDAVIADPPFGLGERVGDSYNRLSEYVVDGYIDVSKWAYPAFTQQWIGVLSRLVRPGGAFIAFSGRTHLRHVLDALARTGMIEINHIVWHYQFGVHTTRKFVESHYHILYYMQLGGQRTFNPYCRYGADAVLEDGRKAHYLDRQDVWTIPRVYKPKQKKCRNELPEELVLKLIEYTTNPGDLILDPFVGSATVHRVGLGMRRRVWGCEKSAQVFRFARKAVKGTTWGGLRETLMRPTSDGVPGMHGQPWADDEVSELLSKYDQLRADGTTKKAAVQALTKHFDRGRFAIQNVLKEHKR